MTRWCRILVVCRVGGWDIKEGCEKIEREREREREREGERKRNREITEKHGAAHQSSTWKMIMRPEVAPSRVTSKD